MIMNEKVFIELLFKNREKRIVERNAILSVEKTPDGSSVTFVGDPVPKLVVHPSYEGLRDFLLSDSRGEAFRI